MKKLLAIGVVVASTSAQAMYIEGQLGHHSTDVSTKSYTGSASSLTWTGLKGEVDYDIDPALGIEIGTNLTDNVRVGASYTSMDAKMESITVSAGSVSDGTTTYNNASGTVTRSQIASLSSGLETSFDNKVKLLMVKAYYDFDMEGDIKPFVGVGIGKADIENATSKETAMSIGFGAKYKIDDSMYVGATYSRTSINGPTDELGIGYEDIDVDSFYLMLGKSF